VLDRRVMVFIERLPGLQRLGDAVEHGAVARIEGRIVRRMAVVRQRRIAGRMR